MNNSSSLFTTDKQEFTIELPHDTTSDQLVHTFSREGIIEAIKNDPRVVLTHKQLSQLIWDTEKQGYDIRMLGGLYPGEYEIVTKELVGKISDMIEHALPTIIAKHGAATILEVGAGKGRLSFTLQQELAKRGITNCAIITTDKDPSPQALLPIEQLEYDKAVATHKPQIILTSWMPMHYAVVDGGDHKATAEDMKKIWPNAFCENENTELYILIGIPGLCGDRSFAWGTSFDHISEIDSVLLGNAYQHLPYIKHGFQRFHNLTPGSHIYNNGNTPTSLEKRSGIGMNIITERDWGKPDEITRKSSFTTAFIRNPQVIKELKAKNII